MVDLGAWATESYRIPIEEDNDQPGVDEAGAPYPPSSSSDA
jgi:endogenous inhibitor of DNA gyrase (YacG/DUF329 family)